MHGRQCPEDEHDVSEESPTPHFLSVFLLLWMPNIITWGLHHIWTSIQLFTKTAHGFGVRLLHRKAALIIPFTIITGVWCFCYVDTISVNNILKEKTVVPSERAWIYYTEINRKVVGNLKCYDVVACLVDLTFAQKVVEDRKGNSWTHWENRIHHFEMSHSGMTDMTKLASDWSDSGIWYLHLKRLW